MTPTHLFGPYYYRSVSAEEFAPFYREHMPGMFAGIESITIESFMTSVQLQRREEYDNTVTALFEMRIFIMYHDEVIGWHIGRQGQRDAGHMSNTALHPDHRGKGIYTALIPRVLEIFYNSGFAKVVSRHNAANNAVIVPKLKAGFVITGFEIDERYGLLIVLTYFFDERRKSIYEFRTGYAKKIDELESSI